MSDFEQKHFVIRDWEAVEGDDPIEVTLTITGVSIPEDAKLQLADKYNPMQLIIDMVDSAGFNMECEEVDWTPSATSPGASTNNPQA